MFPSFLQPVEMAAVSDRMPRSPLTNFANDAECATLGSPAFPAPWPLYGASCCRRVWSCPTDVCEPVRPLC